MKGSQFSRVLRYFREADTLEAEACLVAASKVLAERKRTPNHPPAKRGRPAKVAQSVGENIRGEETLSNA